MNWWNTGTKVQYGSYSLKTAKKPLKAWRYILLTVLEFICFSQMSTQYIAAKYHYSVRLGKPLFIYDGMPVYQPFRWYGWLKICSKYMANSHVARTSVYMTIFFLSFTFLIPLAIYLSQKIAANAKHLQRSLYGSAHWASMEEIRQSGVLPYPGQKAKGVYIGGIQDPKSSSGTIYLRHNGPEHILAFAPTRSGKGVGLVLPTELSWPESTFVFDIKGENYALTAGYRKEVLGQNILRFDPTDASGNGARYNPLCEIRVGTKYEYQDIENLCVILSDPEGKAGNSSDPYWTQAAQSLLIGVITHLLYKCKQSNKEPTLGKVYALMTDPAKPFKSVMQEILTYEHDPKSEMHWTDSNGEATKTHPIAAMKAREFLDKPEKEAGSVLSTTRNAIRMFADPVLNMNVSHATFRLNDIMNAEKPTSLYVCITPANLSRFSSLLRVLITQIVTILADELAFKEGRTVGCYKHRCLLMLDEFPTLGSMPIFERALAFIAGYGLKAYLITQDLTQLQKAYSREEAIMSNCHIQIAYAPNKIETAKYLSDMLGTTTVVLERKSSSSSKGGVSISRSVQEQSRALLTPDELMRLPGALKDANGNITTAGAMVIRVAGFTPIYGKQILYFMDPVFSKRSKIPAPLVSDVITESTYAEDSQITAEQEFDENGNICNIANNGLEAPEKEIIEEKAEGLNGLIQNYSELLESNSDDDCDAFEASFSDALSNGTVKVGDNPQTQEGLEAEIKAVPSVLAKVFARVSEQAESVSESSEEADAVEGGDL